MRMLKLLWALPLGLATLGAAHARGNDVYWSVDVGSPGLAVGVGLYILIPPHEVDSYSFLSYSHLHH